MDSLLFLFLILSTMTLTISLNNVILVLNFVTMCGIMCYLFLISSFINLSLLILLVYASLMSLLFLVNGLMWMDCCNYRFSVSAVMLMSMELLFVVFPFLMNSFEQWMLLIIFFIMENAMRSGMLNYLIMNAITGCVLLMGMLMSNNLFFLVGCFGKIGYFPFSPLLAYLLSPSPYQSSILDMFNKWGYLCSFLVIFNLSCFFNSLDYWLFLINFLVLLMLIKFIFTLKHLMLISTIILFLSIYLLMLMEEEFFSVMYLMKYSLLSVLMLILMIVAFPYVSHNTIGFTVYDLLILQKYELLESIWVMSFIHLIIVFMLF